MCVPASRRFDTANFPWTLVLRSSKVWRFYFCMYVGHIAFNQNPKRLNSNGLFCCTVRFAGDMKVCITLSFCSYAVINVTVTRVSWESEWRQLFDGLTRVWNITGIQTKCAYEVLWSTIRGEKSDPSAVVLPTASGMRKLYPSRVWCSREGMMPFRPIGLQSDCKGVILTNRGLWLDLRHK